MALNPCEKKCYNTVEVEEAALLDDVEARADEQATQAVARQQRAKLTVSAVLIALSLVTLVSLLSNVGEGAPAQKVSQPSHIIQASSSTRKRKPFTFAASGGGFRTMVQAMAFARAISDWSTVSHLTSNSGGNWFASQFVYSKNFYSKVTDANIDIDEVVTAWGAQYETTVATAMDAGLEVFIVFDAATSRVPPCPQAAKIIENIMVPFSNSIGLPAAKWMPFNALLLGYEIPDITSLRYGQRTMSGLASATLVQQTTLPPDAWTSGKATARLIVTSADGHTGSEFNTSHATLPIAHVVRPSGASTWYTGSNVDSISRATGSEKNEQVNPLPLLDSAEPPLLLEVAAASSSAFGGLGSPMIVDALVKEKLPPAEQRIVNMCLPLGIETQAGPLLAPSTELEDSTSRRLMTPLPSSDFQFRFLDGCYSDDTGAAMALAQMQADCHAGELDCSDEVPYRLLILDDHSYDPLRNLMAGSVPGNCTNNTICPSTGYWYPARPSAQIFAESFPESGWKTYAVADAYTGEGKVMGNVTSKFWKGTLTTVDNKWFGVVGGDKVSVIYLSSNYDDSEASVMIPAFSANSGIGMLPQVNASTYFQNVYAPMAVSQLTGGEPVIRKWLREVGL
eukprot:TRINITY_DN29336_c0_g1_i1.p1 TRINITY_DN29336_c0_g1~~TRINITY_DN29336_c0_g1_i1.p1  ORF type:complete len:657 (-),score=72.01 TRINITY_DN29336_c0_g1_i1:127-1995(-)